MSYLDNRVMGLDGKVYEQIRPESNNTEKTVSTNKAQIVKTGTIMDGINNELEEITDSETTLDSNNSLNKLDVSSLDAATIKRLMDYQNRKPSVREYKKIGRNDPCPCGSGKKYKKCCLNTGKYENLVKTK